MKSAIPLLLAAALPFSLLYASPANAVEESSEVQGAPTANTQILEANEADELAEDAPLDDTVTPELKAEALSSNAATTSAASFSLPLPAKSYRVSSFFGNRCSPTIGAGYYHDAVDLAAPLDTNTLAIADGTVASIGEANGAKAAGFITIDHGLWKGKRLVATYMHTWEASKYVKVGQKVKAGQVIAPVGSSGISNGNHLHLAVKLDNQMADLLDVMDSAGVDVVGNATSVSAKNRNVDKCTAYSWVKMGLKSSPDVKSKTIAVLEVNTPLEIQAGPDQKGFVPAKVIATGQTGYVFGTSTTASLRKTPPPAYEVISSPAGVTYTYRSGYSYALRDYPSKSATESGVIVTINGGTDKFVSTGRKTSDGWEEVKFGNYVGWVENVAFVKVQSPVAQPPAVKVDSIAKGDIIVRDGKGQLLNYGNMAKKSTAPRVISTGWANFKSITSTDFNGDGVMDIVGNSGAKLYLYLGKKGGGFQPAKVIGTSGWTNAELNAVKTTKTNKYPSLMVRFPNGNIVRYDVNGGKTLKGGVTIGNGWKSFKQVTWGYVDNDSKIDAITKDASGKLVLYRTDGSKFISEKRPVVGAGWTSYTMSTVGNTISSGTTATVAKTGQKLYHYTHKGGKLVSTKLIGNGGWSPMYLINQSI